MDSNVIPHVDDSSMTVGHVSAVHSGFYRVTALHQGFVALRFLEMKVALFEVLSSLLWILIDNLSRILTSC